MKVAVVALLLIAALLAVEATPLSFVLRFHGTSNAKDKGAFSLRAPSQVISTVVSTNDAVRFDVHDVIGSYATINGQETAFSNSTFTVTGNITFGTHQFQDNHALYYKSLGLGHEQRGPMGHDVQLSAIWNVFAGKGVFSGAYGTVVVTCRFEPINSADITCFAIGNVFVP